MSTTPLPWFIAGPLIGFIVPLLLVLREKQFGVSSTYRYIGGVVFPKIPYFNYYKDADKWQLQFAIGLVLAGLLVRDIQQWWKPWLDVAQSEVAVEQLRVSVYGWSNGWVFLLGGFLVGFGSRYANGCTAGHCIMGVSQFALSSVLATAAFFSGGLFVSHFVVPLLF